MVTVISNEHVLEWDIFQKIFASINSYSFSVIPRKDGRSQPKIEEPDEENRGYEGIMPGHDGTPDTGAAPEKNYPDDPDHPDLWIPEEPESQPAYAGGQEEVLPPDLTSSDPELDPSTEEGIPRRPTEVDFPNEPEYDKKDESPEIIPDAGQERPEVDISEEGAEIENPQEKEVDPDKIKDD